VLGEVVVLQHGQCAQALLVEAADGHRGAQRLLELGVELGERAGHHRRDEDGRVLGAGGRRLVVLAELADGLEDEAVHVLARTAADGDR
jgi:hypothetical protein